MDISLETWRVCKAIGFNCGRFLFYYYNFFMLPLFHQLMDIFIYISNIFIILVITAHNLHAFEKRFLILYQQ